jgi:hypothetical protein
VSKFAKSHEALLRHNHENRLRKFDEASQRQHDRELSRFEKQDSESVTDRGWTREDLYDGRIQKILETP